MGIISGYRLNCSRPLSTTDVGDVVQQRHLTIQCNAMFPDGGLLSYSEVDST